MITYVHWLLFYLIKNDKKMVKIYLFLDSGFLGPILYNFFMAEVYESS